MSDVSEIIAESLAGHPAVGEPIRQQRSRITNGTGLLPGVDGRSPWVRRCKDLIREHMSDLGGPDNTTAAERSILRRAATLTVECERLEAKFALAEVRYRPTTWSYTGARRTACVACWRRWGYGGDRVM